MDRKPGEIIGERYKIIRPLGGGGFGKTYLAEDQQLSNRQCVVKQLKPQPHILKVLPWADLKARFDKEANCLANLGDHPQIPALLDKFEDNQEFYLVQQFIDGAELSKEILRGQPWSEENVIALLRDVLVILVFVHKQQVIHRDIKPDNLIRREVDGKLVLIDFGAIKEIGSLAVDTAGQVIAGQTLAINTPGYAPPEQKEGRPNCTSDLYALGVIAIRALTGAVATELQNPETGQLNWRGWRGAQVSRKLAEILDKMVHPDYNQRYQSATEILKDLQNLQPPGSPPVPPPPPSKPPVQRWHIFAILVIAGALLFVAPKLLSFFQAKALYDQGNELFNKGQYEDAIVVFDRALQIKSNYTEAKAKKGIALLSLKQPELALKVCQEAIDKDAPVPEASEAWNCKGLGLYNLKNYSDAITSYDEAIRLDPKYEAPWNNRCEARLLLKKYQQALEDCNQAIALKPDYPFALSNKGYSLLGLQQYQDAINAFREALKIKPGYPRAEAGLREAQKKLDSQKSNSQNP
ncbi:MAG: tetratricopeptide repeat protein [Oscillatoria princeps RMCB-10]|jgi:serine/threonine protein kinase|nr:tetratricopeptide repeat protein [Oscillatoria princeps RMCB-10]